jgi:hypothetical protein
MWRLEYIIHGQSTRTRGFQWRHCTDRAEHGTKAVKTGVRMRAKLVIVKLLEFTITLQVCLFRSSVPDVWNSGLVGRLFFCKLHEGKFQIERKVKLPPHLCNRTCSHTLDRSNGTAKLVASGIEWQSSYITNICIVFEPIFFRSSG